MEGSGPGYDDWFGEPEAPTHEDEGRAVYDGGDEDEVWVVPEEGGSRRRGGSGGDINIGGLALTRTQAIVIGLAALAILLAILAAAGVFSSSSKPQTLTVTTPPVTVTVTTSGTTTGPSSATAPTTTLKPGDTGAQVVALQNALTSLGYSPGKADGDYGPSTEAAVKEFQTAKGLTADGVVGPQTLAALKNDLSG